MRVTERMLLDGYRGLRVGKYSACIVSYIKGRRITWNYWDTGWENDLSVCDRGGTLPLIIVTSQWAVHGAVEADAGNNDHPALLKIKQDMAQAELERRKSIPRPILPAPSPEARRRERLQSLNKKYCALLYRMKPETSD